jgi:hypothetical protein
MSDNERDDPRGRSQGPAAGWPEDEPEPTPEELAAASALAGRTERLLAGEATAEDEVLADAEDPLLGVALVRAAAGEARLPAERRDALVRAALQEARGTTVAEGARRPGAGRPGALRRAAPALALAASLLLVALSFITLLRVPRSRPAAEPTPRVLLSRPSNDLMGRPFEDRAAAARRLDLVFADRLAGYRRLTLAGGAR